MVASALPDLRGDEVPVRREDGAEIRVFSACRVD